MEFCFINNVTEAVKTFIESKFVAQREKKNDNSQKPYIFFLSMSAKLSIFRKKSYNFFKIDLFILERFFIFEISHCRNTNSTPEKTSCLVVLSPLGSRLVETAANRFSKRYWARQFFPTYYCLPMITSKLFYVYWQEIFAREKIQHYSYTCIFKKMRNFIF